MPNQKSKLKQNHVFHLKCDIYAIKIEMNIIYSNQDQKGAYHYRSNDTYQDF